MLLKPVKERINMYLLHKSCVGILLIYYSPGNKLSILSSSFHVGLKTYYRPHEKLVLKSTSRKEVIVPALRGCTGASNWNVAAVPLSTVPTRPWGARVE